MSAGKIGLWNSINDRTSFCTQTFFKDFFCIRASYGMHGIKTHLETTIA